MGHQWRNIDGPSVVTPTLGTGSWLHDDGLGVLTNIVSTSADVGNDLGIGSDGGSYLDLVAGTNVTLVSGGGGQITINAAPGGGSTSVVTPNLGAGSWVHDDGLGTLQTIVSTSADVGNDLVPGSDGGSFLDVQAGTGISLTNVGGVLTVTSTVVDTNDTSVVTPNLVTGTWVHDDGTGNTVSIVSTSGDAGNDLIVGSDGGSYVNLQQHHEFDFDAYDINQPGVSPGHQFTVAGTINWAIEATTAPDANEDWDVFVAGVNVGTITLPNAATQATGTIATAIAAGSRVTIAPSNVANPASPSTFGSVTFEIL